MYGGRTDAGADGLVGERVVSRRRGSRLGLPGVAGSHRTPRSRRVPRGAAGCRAPWVSGCRGECPGAAGVRVPRVSGVAGSRRVWESQGALRAAERRGCPERPGTGSRRCPPGRSVGAWRAGRTLPFPGSPTAPQRQECSSGGTDHQHQHPVFRTQFEVSVLKIGSLHRCVNPFWPGVLCRGRRDAAAGRRPESRLRARYSNVTTSRRSPLDRHELLALTMASAFISRQPATSRGGVTVVPTGPELASPVCVVGDRTPERLADRQAPRPPRELA